MKDKRIPSSFHPSSFKANAALRSAPGTRGGVRSARTRREGRARSAVDILVARIRRKPEVAIDGLLTQALATLSTHLDRQKVATLAETSWKIHSP
jgi:hypothetical protein